jgi:hypothetical protein
MHIAAPYNRPLFSIVLRVFRVDFHITAELFKKPKRIKAQLGVNRERGSGREGHTKKNAPGDLHGVKWVCRQSGDELRQPVHNPGLRFWQPMGRTKSTPGHPSRIALDSPPPKK